MTRRLKEKVQLEPGSGYEVFYINEIVSEVGARSLFKVKDVDDLKEAPATMGMEKIYIKSPLGRYFVDLLHNSTIHGLNHFVAPRRHKIERFLAGLFVFSSLVCLILMSRDFWNRYQHEAVVVVVDTDYRNFNITKPSILLCSDKRINEIMFPEVFAKYDVEDTAEARQFFTYLANVTYESMDKLPLYEDTPSDKWLQILYELRYEFEYKVISVEDLTTTYVKWDNWIVTERGICLSLLNFISGYVTIDYWQSNSRTTLPIPKYLPSYAYDYRHERITVQFRSFGGDFAILNPLDVAMQDDAYYRVLTSQIVTVKVGITEVGRSESIRDLSVSQRKCRFLHEAGLSMWPIYTKNMCILNCKYELMRQACGCLPHFVKPIPGVPICNAHQLRCISSSRNNLTKYNQDDLKVCDCVRTCESSNYNVLVRDSFSYMTKPLKNTNGTIASISNGAINIDIVFPYRKFKIEVLFTYSDFLGEFTKAFTLALASVGGAAGLLLGASVISFVEIFYYLTLRLFWYKVALYREAKNQNVTHLTKEIYSK